MEKKEIIVDEELIKKNFGFNKIERLGGIQKYFDYLVKLDSALVGNNEEHDGVYYKPPTFDPKYFDEKAKKDRIAFLTNECLNLVNQIIGLIPRNVRTIIPLVDHCYIPNDSALFFIQEYLYSVVELQNSIGIEIEENKK